MSNVQVDWLPLIFLKLELFSQLSKVSFRLMVSNLVTNHSHLIKIYSHICDNRVTPRYIDLDIVRHKSFLIVIRAHIRLLS